VTTSSNPRTANRQEPKAYPTSDPSAGVDSNKVAEKASMAPAKKTAPATKKAVPSAAKRSAKDTAPAKRSVTSAAKKVAAKKVTPATSKEVAPNIPDAPDTASSKVVVPGVRTAADILADKPMTPEEQAELDAIVAASVRKEADRTATRDTSPEKSSDLFGAVEEATANEAKDGRAGDDLTLTAQEREDIAHEAVGEDHFLTPEPSKEGAKKAIEALIADDQADRVKPSRISNDAWVGLLILIALIGALLWDNLVNKIPDTTANYCASADRLDRNATEETLDALGRHEPTGTLLVTFSKGRDVAKGYGHIDNGVQAAADNLAAVNTAVIDAVNDGSMSPEKADRLQERLFAAEDAFNWACESGR
jgi:hypothetical protein